MAFGDRKAVKRGTLRAAGGDNLSDPGRLNSARYAKMRKIADANAAANLARRIAPKVRAKRANVSGELELPHRKSVIERMGGVTGVSPGTAKSAGYGRWPVGFATRSSGPQTSAQRRSRGGGQPTGSSGSTGSRYSARRGERGFFDEPRATQPNNTPRDRLGIRGQRTSHSSGFIFNDFGRSNVGGMASSYKPRAVLAFARNPLTRVRLSGPGFAALMTASAANSATESLNRAATRAGNPGGFASMSFGDQVKFLDDGGWVGRTSWKHAGSMFRRAAGLAGEALSGLSSFIAFTANNAGIVSDERLAVTLTNLMRVDELASVWVEEGYGEKFDAAERDLIKHGSLAAAKLHREKNKAAARANRSAARFIGEVAEELSGKIIGVDGRDVLAGLQAKHGDTVRKLEDNARRKVELDAIAGAKE